MDILGESGKALEKRAFEVRAERQGRKTSLTVVSWKNTRVWCVQAMVRSSVWLGVYKNNRR